MYLMKVHKGFSVSIFLLAITVVSSVVNAKELDPVNLVKEMGKEIAGFNSFILQGDTYVDARLDAGQIIEQSAQVTMRVARPGLIRITNKSLETTKEIYLEDHQITIYDSSTGFYGQKEIPSEIKDPLKYSVDRLGIDVPLLDILDRDLTLELLEQATEVQYLGESLVRGNTYHQIGFRLPEIDLQLWIRSEGRPLPGKFVISAKWEGGSPRTVSFINWEVNPTISPESLKFDAPKNAIRIEIQTND